MRNENIFERKSKGFCKARLYFWFKRGNWGIFFFRKVHLLKMSVGAWFSLILKVTRYSFSSPFITELMVSEWEGKSNKFGFQQNLVYKNALLLLLNIWKECFFFFFFSSRLFNKSREHAYKDPNSGELNGLNIFSIPEWSFLAIKKNGENKKKIIHRISDWRKIKLFLLPIFFSFFFF